MMVSQDTERAGAQEGREESHYWAVVSMLLIPALGEAETGGSL